MHGDETLAPSFELLRSAWDLFRDPVLCGAIAGFALGFLGVFIVLRRTVFLSAAVTQSSALGVALTFYAEIHLGLALDPIVGAAAMALLSTLLVSIDPRRFHLTHDGLLGLAYALASGLTVLVGDRISQEAHDIQGIIFGSAVLVRPIDLALVGCTSATVVALHLWWRRGLVFAAFEPESARVQGLPVRLLTGFLFVSIGAVIGVSARALGAMPVFAFSVLPAAAVLALNVRLGVAFAVAGGLGAIAGAGGYLVAFFAETPVGATQTLVASSFAVCVCAYRMVRKLAARLRR